MKGAALRSALAACLSVGAVDLCALNMLVLPEVLAISAPLRGAHAAPTRARKPAPPPKVSIEQRHTEARLETHAQTSPETIAPAVPVAIVEFITSSRHVDDRGSRALSEVLEQLRPAAVIRLVGHADATGAAELNELLSQRRAEAVARALVQAGIARARISVSWRGAREPRGEGESKRVEIYLGEAP